MPIIIHVWGSQPHQHPVRLLPRSALFRWRYVPPRAPHGAELRVPLSPLIYHHFPVTLWYFFNIAIENGRL